MPEKRTTQRARRLKQEGKRATTQASPFVEEEMKRLKEGRLGKMSPKQAIAVGLSKARRAGVELPPPGEGRVKAKTQRSAQSAYRRGQESGELARGGKKKTAGRGSSSRSRKPGGSSSAKRPSRKR